jgi:predicted P-loop ATPase
VIAFREAQEWSRVLGFDALRQRTVLRNPPPWGAPGARDVDWENHDDLLAAIWLQENQISVTPEVAGQAIEVVARESKFHPVREHLDGLRWDGKPRLETWLSYYMGVDDSEYSRAVGKMLDDFCDCARVPTWVQGRHCDCL